VGFFTVSERTKTGQRPILYLKIFGERNTGSNYLHQVCARNFLVTQLRGDVQEIWGLGQRIAGQMGNQFQVRQALHDLEIRRILRSDFGWKHAAPDLAVIDASEIAKYTRFVVLTKHPYSWLKSLHRNPYSFQTPHPDFSRFIRSDFPLNGSDGLPGVAPCTPPALLRHKALAYRRLLQSPNDAIHLKYEDLIEDFEAAMRRLQPRMFRKTGSFLNVEKDVKGQKRQLADFQRQYSLASVRQGIQDADVDFIRAELGEDIFAFLGYQS
jgi:hypothetical protein